MNYASVSTCKISSSEVLSWARVPVRVMLAPVLPPPVSVPRSTEAVSVEMVEPASGSVMVNPWMGELELTVKAAAQQKNKSKRLSPRALTLAVRHDDDLGRSKCLHNGPTHTYHLSFSFG